MVHKVIINDWITQHCEDAADLEGYKNSTFIHIGLLVFSKKIWKKLKSFKLRLQTIYQFLAETLLLTSWGSVAN